MGQISSWNKIDFDMLRSLSKKRGYGVVHKDYLNKIQDALEQKRNERVIQCTCGDLLIVSSQHFDSLKKGVKDDKWCKRCRVSSLCHLDYLVAKKALKLDFSIPTRTANVERLLKEFEFNHEDKSIYCPEYRLEVIKKLGDGLFPANNIFEFLYGYSAFARDWLKSINFILIQLQQPFLEKYRKYKTEITKLTKDLLKIDHQKTYNLLEILTPEKLHAILSPNRFQELLRLIETNRTISNDIFSTNCKDIVIEKDEAWANLALSTYNQAFETQAALDVLKNMDNIISNKQVSSTPFKNIKGCNSKYNQVDHLKNSNLPVGIKRILDETYDNRLRNSLSHNQYRINASLRRVELTKYNEIRTFETIETLKENIMQFQTALFEHLDEVRHKNYIDNCRDWGIDKIELKTNKDDVPVLKIKQFTYFINHSKNYFPTPIVLFSSIHRAIEICFGKEGYSFYIPFEKNNILWLNTLLKKGKLIVERKEIAPLLPQYKTKSQEVIKLNWETCFVLSTERRIFTIDDHDLNFIKSQISDVDQQSPLTMNFNKEIETVYNESELKNLQIKDLKVFYSELKTNPSLKNDLKQSGITEKFLNLPVKKQINMNLTAQHIQEGIFYVEKVYDDDYSLYGLFFKQIYYMVLVENRNIKEKLYEGEYIKAKIISFTFLGNARVWDFVKVYRP